MPFLLQVKKSQISKKMPQFIRTPEFKKYSKICKNHDIDQDFNPIRCGGGEDFDIYFCFQRYYWNESNISFWIQKSSYFPNNFLEFSSLWPSMQYLFTKLTICKYCLRSANFFQGQNYHSSGANINEVVGNY